MTLQQLVTEARQLSRNEMSDLVDQLLADSFGRPDPEIDELWRTETQRRLAEIQSGKVALIPGEEVMTEVRKIVGLWSRSPSIPKPATNCARRRSTTGRSIQSWRSGFTTKSTT